MWICCTYYSYSGGIHHQQCEYVAHNSYSATNNVNMLHILQREPPPAMMVRTTTTVNIIAHITITKVLWLLQLHLRSNMRKCTLSRLRSAHLHSLISLYSLPEEARSLLFPNSRSLSPKKVSKVADLELNENPEGGLRYRHGQMRIFIFCQWLYSTDVWESIEASADCRDVQTNLSCLHIQLTILICNKLQHPNFQVWKFHVEILVTTYPKNPKYWDR